MVSSAAWLLIAVLASAEAQSTSLASVLSSSLSNPQSVSSTSGTQSASSSSSSSSSSNAAFSYTQNISYVTGSITETAFTGSQYTYLSYGNQITRTSSLSTTQSSSSSNATASSSRRTTSQSLAVTELVGSAASSTANGTASATSSSATPTNTLPCNNYPEFCNRKYSNITEVCAHNSAFAVKNNAGSNQVLGIQDQLNDGIRMLQGETHLWNGSIQNCHTSCDLLNAGTWQSSLETLVAWLQRHPYDVVTWLVVNSDFLNVQEYTSAIENSGIRQYLYEPDYIPQRRDQWPTLGQMILSGKRVVMFMDYNANQTALPYILDEFTHMWETPFSPTNQSFPCTQQRPPSLNQTVARDDFMYLANHNLNVAISLSALLGTSDDSTILIPNTAEINETNGLDNSFGQLGATGANCTAMWDRPPNFLLVDYYNYGLPQPGSVFEVAAKLNGVTYNRQCCGTTTSPASRPQSSLLVLVVALAFAVCLLF